jgi:hypothetical protein
LLRQERIKCRQNRPSLIALGNPACPNKFAKRPADEMEAALPFLWFVAI